MPTATPNPISSPSPTSGKAGGLTALPAIYGYGTNLVQNGGFETAGSGTPVANWTLFTLDGTFTRDTAITHSGGASLRLDISQGTSKGDSSARQTISLPPGRYTLGAWIKTSSVVATTTAGGVQANISCGFNANEPMMPMSGTGMTAIKGTSDWTFYQVQNMIVSSTCAANLSIGSYQNPSSGTAWFDDIVVQAQTPPPLDVFLLYPNYRGVLFDDQSQTMQFDVKVTPPSGSFTNLSVHGTLVNEATNVAVASANFSASADITATLDGTSMQVGATYLANFSLVDAGTGNVIYTYPAYRVSKAAGTSRAKMNVSFDAANHVLLHGTPRFILGMYDSGFGYTNSQATWDQYIFSPTGYRRAGGLDFNLYLNYWEGAAPSSSIDLLDADLLSHGAMFLQSANCDANSPVPTVPMGNIQPDLAATTDSYVQNLAAQAGNAGYYLADECSPFLVPGVFAQYKRIESLDPSSLAFGTLLPQATIALWRDTLDVVATDPYPMNNRAPYPQQEVADATIMTKHAVMNARPFFTTLQFFNGQGGAPWPTLDQLRGQAYMAIVEGAEGLFWWSLGTRALADVCNRTSVDTTPDSSGWCPFRSSLMTELTSVVNEISALEPELLAEDSPGELTSNSNSAAIHTKVKVLNGQIYIFSYNYTNANVTATFGFNPTYSAATTQISVNAESRMITPTGATFTDTFTPYQAHVYVISPK